MATVETQRVAGAVFLEILQRNLVPIQTYSQTFLPTVLLGMDNRDPGMNGLSHQDLAHTHTVCLIDGTCTR